MVRLNIPLDPAKTGRDAVALESNLRRMIVGQDEAIQQIVNIYQMNLTRMSAPGRPIGNLLFLGPTGSGKTRIVEATAEALLKNPRVVIKSDCAEFQHSHEIAKLIGSPPGYLGHRETHPLLSQEVLNQYHTDTVKLSFVLFDEIEKASAALWTLLLGIMDKGTLTLGDNRKVDFSRAMIFMTSNLGASEMSAPMNPRLGFQAATARENVANGTVDQDMSGKLAKSGVEAARRKFTPECMNRLDKIVTFQLLGSAELKYGARHLKRAIERLLVQPMANLFATKQVCGGRLGPRGLQRRDPRASFRPGSRGIARARYGAAGGQLGHYSSSRVHQGSDN